MLVVMHHTASEEEVGVVVDVIEKLGYEARCMPGRQRTTVGVVGNDGHIDSARMQGLPGVLEIIPVTKAYKQVSREWKAEDTIVTLENGTAIGGRSIAVMAGPCSVESEGQILDIAGRLEADGATWEEVSDTPECIQPRLGGDQLTERRNQL